MKVHFVYNTQLDIFGNSVCESDEYEVNINKRGEENVQIASFWTVYLFLKNGRGMCKKLFYFAYFILQLLKVIYSQLLHEFKEII